VNGAGEAFVTGAFMFNVKFSDTDSLTSAGLWDIFLAKYDNNGALLDYWNVGSGARVQVSTDLLIDAAGDVILSGTFGDSIQIDESTTFYSSDGFDDYFYAKFSGTDGSLLWAKQIKAISDVKSGKIFAIEQNSTSYFFAGAYADSVIIEDDTVVSMNKDFDVHLFSTDFDGNVNWIRSIKGMQAENCYSLAVDNEENVYVNGFYLSKALTVDSTANDTIRIEEHYGNYDYFIAKYSNEGELAWIRTAGGPDNDYIWDAAFNNDRLQIAGSFVKSIQWGGLELSTTSDTDSDAFLGELEKDGSFRKARNYYSEIDLESDEEMLAVFFANEKQYSVMRSNASTIVLDKAHNAVSDNFYVLLGVVGCLEVSIDTWNHTELLDCAGDSTGQISFSVSSNFGPPYQFSVDNGETYQDIPLFSDLPAGDYQLVALDGENCDGVGPLLTISQPDSLNVEIIGADPAEYWIDQVDTTLRQFGNLTVAAGGGNDVNYIFTLLPNNTEQIRNGAFADLDSGMYVVEVTNVDGCAPVRTDTIEISAAYFSTGINGPRALDANIYPNPSRSYVTIELDMDADEVQMEVLSLTGQIVHRSVVHPSAGVLHETLDVSGLAQGMYMLRLNGRSVNTRIIVQ